MLNKLFSLNRRVTWSAWQFAVFKWSVASIGLLAGCYFAEFVRPFTWLLVIGALVTTPFTIKWWLCDSCDATFD